MQIIEGAVIACAGLGSRLGMGMPKCMLELGGKTLLSHLIETLRPLVPQIHVVVGYREELIIEHCAQYHRDVVIIRNKNFRTTNTAHSILMGSVGMHGKVLYLDGDLFIDPKSLQKFVGKAALHPLLIGVTEAKSTQAVFVSTENSPHSLQVTAFHRNHSASLEWANIFCGSPNMLFEGSRYVYECIEPFLPAPAQEITLQEIDTPEDFELAKAWFDNLRMNKRI